MINEVIGFERSRAKLIQKHGFIETVEQRQELCAFSWCSPGDTWGWPRVGSVF